MVSIYKFNTIEDNDTIKVFHSSQKQEYNVLSVYYDENNNRIIDLDTDTASSLITFKNKVYLERRAKAHPSGWTTKIYVNKIKIL